MIVQITDDNFEKEVVKSDIPVLIDFWSPSCMPCKMLAPVFSELSEGYKGKLKFVKADVNENMELAGRFRITGIPALVLTKNGKDVDRIVGFAPKELLKSKIDFMLERL